MAYKSKSEAIRRLLEANPNTKPAAIIAALADDGVVVTADLVRVVRANWRKAAIRAEPNVFKVRLDEIAIQELECVATDIEVYRRADPDAYRRFTSLRSKLPQRSQVEAEARSFLETVIPKLHDHLFEYIFRIACDALDKSDGAITGTTLQMVVEFSSRFEANGQPVKET